jgi:hypothetical protein
MKLATHRERPSYARPVASSDQPASGSRAGTQMVLMLTLCCWLVAMLHTGGRVVADEQTPSLFARDNLVAWCIVPFDDRDRSPRDRAAMLQRIGIRRLAL